MDIRDFELEASERWGRIRLLNLMLQRKTDVISEDFLTLFDLWVSNWHSDHGGSEPARLSTPSSSSAIRPEDFYRRAECQPEPGDDCLFLRCIPLPAVWSHYFPISNAGDDRIERAYEAVENDLADMARLSAPFPEGTMRDLEGRVRLALRSIRDWQLDEGADAVQSAVPTPLIRVRPQSGCSVHGRDRRPDNRPRFTTPFEAGSAGRQKNLIETALSTSAPADSLRDVLGLDHYDRDFRGAPNVLGFIAYRFGDLLEKQISRPTPLDDASLWRFRGIYGNSSGRRSNWGFTVDLSNMDSGASADANERLKGAMEAVMTDTMLKDDTVHMYIGFAGILRLPEGDFRNGLGADVAKIERYDEAYEEHLKHDISDDVLKDFFVRGAR